MRTGPLTIGGLVLLVAVGCGAPLPRAPHTPPSRAQPPAAATGTLGRVTYSDGTPAAGAALVITALDSGARVAAATADEHGVFRTNVTAGDYAIAITAANGSLWSEHQTFAGPDTALRLTTDCQHVRGRVTPVQPGAHVEFVHHAFQTGDTFFVPVGDDGQFATCLPLGDYTVALAGELLSLGVELAVPSSTDLVLQGVRRHDIERAPTFAGPLPHELDGLVTDIIHSDAVMVGLGEASHGSAEFVTARAQLTLALARQGGLDLVLFEADLVTSMALDRYVNGDDIDLHKAVAALGFWITDTYDFLGFLDEVRAYNLARPVAAHTRVHLWGIDVQHTEPAVQLLGEHAARLALSADEQAMLRELAPNRAKAVLEFPPPRRASLDALLHRLSLPRGPDLLDLQLAAAGRSLSVQVGYLEGDRKRQYIARRDAGMAGMARFLVEQTGAQRACLWAHNDHIARIQREGPSMGQRLATNFANRYYPVAFFGYQGAARAWDAAGKLGVVSHPVRPAPAFTAEGAIMTLTGAPDIAWLPLRQLPPPLRAWFERPRYVRELGAVYYGEARTLLLFPLLDAFDALVVIKTLHATSPTPTGVRGPR